MRGHINPLQRQKQINSRLKNGNARLRTKVSHLEAENADLRIRLETVLLQVEELRIIVFGKKKIEDEKQSDVVKDHDDTKPKGGPRLPSSYVRPVPKDEDVTDTQEHPVTHCPDCHVALVKKQRVIRYIEDIRFACMDGSDGFKKTKQITKHVIEKGYCPDCRKWHSAIPISPKVTRAGPSVRLFIVHAVNILRLSYSQTIQCLDAWFGFALSEGEITNMLEKASVDLRPEYECIHARILESCSVHLDETGHRTGSEKNFNWILASGETEEALFVVGKSRGKGNAEELLKEYAGVRVTDGYAGYTYLSGAQQRCWAHILRKVRDLKRTGILDESKHAFVENIYTRLRTYFHKLTDAIERPFEQAERDIALPVFEEELRGIVTDIAKSPLKIEKLTAIGNEIGRALPQYLTCVTHRDVAPTNNKAERKLRHLVIKRKTSFGTKTAKGDRILETNMSVSLSLWWMDREAFFPRLAQLMG